MVTCGSSPEQELVRLLQQTLRTSQCSRQPAAHPAETPQSAEQDRVQGAEEPREQAGRLETLLQERDEQVQSLSCHMERLTLERDSLQQELKSLKMKVGEINDQLGMLMETIEAKDDVIMKLSQSSEQGAGVTEAGPNVPNKAQQEVDVLKVRNPAPERAGTVVDVAEPVGSLVFQDSLQGYKSQNKFLNKEILELTELRRNAENREKVLEAKVAYVFVVETERVPRCGESPDLLPTARYAKNETETPAHGWLWSLLQCTVLEAKLCQVECKHLVLLQEVKTPVCSSSEQSQAHEVISRLLEDALQSEPSDPQDQHIFKPNTVR